MASEAQRRASRKYSKEMTKVFPVKVNKKTEKDIYEHLETQDNVNGYIKQLIRDNIKDTK